MQLKKSVTSLRDSYSELRFDVVPETCKTFYGVGDDEILGNLGPIVFLENTK